MLTELLGRWTRRYNLRRAAEQAAALGFQALGVGVLATWLEPKLWALLVPLAILAAVRLRRARRTPAVHARHLDQALDTHGLLAAAHAIEAGTATSRLSGTVLARAYQTAPTLDVRVDRIVFPRNSAAAALVALGALALHEPIARLPAAFAAPDPEPVAVDIPRPDPLPEEERQAIAQVREEVKALSRIPHLTPEARERLLAAEAALEQVATGEAGGTEALTRLGQAEELLEDLADEAEDGELFEQDALKETSDTQLAQALAEAMERGDTELAAELLEEAGRRVEEAPGGAELGELGNALEKASTGKDGLKEAGELLKAGHRKDGKKALGKAKKGMAKGKGKDTGDRLGEMGRKSRKAREAEMARMMGEEKDGAGTGDDGFKMPGDGDSPEGRRVIAGVDDPMGGAGEEGGIDLAGGAQWDGDSSEGNPSTSPGPGEADNTGTDPTAVKADDEWIETQWTGAPERLLDTVDGHARGEDGDARFVEVHQRYSNVAEAAGESQDLPLSRRELARDYFEEIKP